MPKDLKKQTSRKGKMNKRVIHVVGTGTIGEPLIGLLCDYQKELGIDEVTFSKKQALLVDRSKVAALMRRGAKLCAEPDAWEAFKKIGLETTFRLDEALERAAVVIDCTPVGNQNKVQYYEKFIPNTLGFIAQGSEFGFGKMYARGINDDALVHGKEKFIQVVSCNTHNLSVLIQSIAHDNGKAMDGLAAARFVCIRRANDISQDNDFIPAHKVDKHKEGRFGTHHARDAHELFKTLDLDLNVFSSSIKTNTQYMHTVWFDLSLKRGTTKDEVIQRLKANDRVALSHKNSSNLVFSFGRDHGHYGRILNQTVVVEATVDVFNEGTEVVGWSFTPQDGNSLLSSIAAMEFFLYPDEYDRKIQCLKPYFFAEV
jgi:glyceraldehyde-3-phosphate dehydrogenase (NAD(P))